MCPTFDPDTFMQQTVDQPLETDFKLVPEGDYQAMIGDFDSSAMEQHEFTYKQGPRTGSPGVMTKFNCPFQINDPKLMAAIGRDDATVKMQCFIDVGPDGGLDFGVNKNVQLGRIRAAVGQNNPGPWQISQLRGAGPVMVHVTHKRGKRKDGSDFEMAEVDRVVRIS